MYSLNTVTSSMRSLFLNQCRCFQHVFHEASLRETSGSSDCFQLQMCYELYAAPSVWFKAVYECFISSDVLYLCASSDLNLIVNYIMDQATFETLNLK